MKNVPAENGEPDLRASIDAEEPRQHHRMTASSSDSGLGGGHPVTPDGRYFVVRGRLWRMSNPALPEDLRATLVSALMDARRAVAAAKRNHDTGAERDARRAVDRAKNALGERGPVWWSGAPDLNRHMARNTIYAVWFAGLS